MLGGLVQGMTGGGLAEIAVREEYPNLPPPLACYFVYYQAYYHSIVEA